LPETHRAPNALDTYVLQIFQDLYVSDYVFLIARPSAETFSSGSHEAIRRKKTFAMYNSPRVSGIAVNAALMLALSVPMLRADTINKKTVLTFGQAVEIPGMILQPGTYVFQLENTPLDRDMVQVFDKDRTHLLTSFLAIPDYRLEPTNKTVVQLEERGANAPEAVHSWFYAGESDGLEFVYPKSNLASVVAKPAAH